MQLGLPLVVYTVAVIRWDTVPRPRTTVAWSAAAILALPGAFLVAYTHIITTDVLGAYLMSLRGHSDNELLTGFPVTLTGPLPVDHPQTSPPPPAPRPVTTPAVQAH